MTTLSERHLKWLPLGLTAVAFGAANGMGYGGGNLQQYLLHGLHAADPSFLTRDWFTVETRPHHVLFTALLGVLARVMRPELALGTLNLICTSIFALCVHAVARRFYRVPLLVTSMTLVIILGSPRSPIALVSMLTSYFQPSTVGAVGLLGGMVLLAKERWRPASAVLLVAGIFHIGYAIWVELLVATVIILHGRTIGFRHVAWLIAVAATVGVMHLPFFLAAHGPDQLPWTAQAGKILHDVYMPYHSRPRTWPGEQWIRAASILSAGAIAVATMPRLRRLTPMEWTLVGFVSTISLIGLLLTLVVEWDVMAMLLPYRVALFTILAAQIAAAGALVSDTRSARPLSHTLVIQTLIFVLLRQSGLSEYAGVTVAFASAALTVSRAAYDIRLSNGQAWAIAAALCVLMALAGAGRNTLAVFTVFAIGVTLFHRVPSIAALRAIFAPLNLEKIAIALLVVINLTWMGRAAATRKDLLGDPNNPANADLFAWCRANTPADAVFAIPPDLSGFRLQARRATVIDYKCMPILPADTVRWATRLAEVCGRPIQSTVDAHDGYRQMNPARATALKSKYDVSYVVLPKDVGRSAQIWPVEPLYENQTFVVHSASHVAPSPSQAQASAVLEPLKRLATVPN